MTVGRPPVAERVVFPSARRVRLVGLWHAGAGQAAVVLCHGMESSKEGVKSVRLAEALAGAGCGVLRFDFSYVGESEGDFADLTVSGEVDDLAGAWDFVARRASGPVGIIGSSLGGTVALLFAAGEPRVAALATIAAVAEPGRSARALSAEEQERWRRVGFYDLHGVRLNATFLDDVERVDVPAAVARIRCPLLIAHGTMDAVVPCSDADVIAARSGGPCEVRRYDGADHRFSDPTQRDRLLRDVAAWMLEQLLAARAGQGGAERRRTNGRENRGELP